MPFRSERDKPFPCVYSLAHALKHESHFLADVVLYVTEANTTFPCHGLVLEARSARFRQMLYHARCNHVHSAECFLTRCKYILELDHPFGADSPSFSAFMELLYDGKVSRVGAAKRATVFSLCEFYQVGSDNSSPDSGPGITSVATKQRAAPSRDAVTQISPRKGPSRKGSQDVRNSSVVRFNSPVEDEFVKNVKREVAANESFESNETSPSVVSALSNDEADGNANLKADPQTDPQTDASPRSPPVDDAQCVESGPFIDAFQKKTDLRDDQLELEKAKADPVNDAEESHQPRAQATDKSLGSAGRSPNAGPRATMAHKPRSRPYFGSAFRGSRPKTASTRLIADVPPAASNSLTSTSSANASSLGADADASTSAAIASPLVGVADPSFPAKNASTHGADTDASKSSTDASTLEVNDTTAAMVLRMTPPADEGSGDASKNKITEYTIRDVGKILKDAFGANWRTPRRVYRGEDGNSNSCLLVRLAKEEAAKILARDVELMRGSSPLIFVTHEVEIKREMNDVQSRV